MQTYELYLEEDKGRRRFEPLACETAKDVLPKVRLLLAEQDLSAVEVRLAGQHLFTLAR